MADTRIDELRRRLERDPGSRLFAQLAEELRKGGELAEAVRVARSGLAVHPAYASARLTLGRALLDSGDATAARSELESVLREAPDNIQASRYLAQARDQLGDLAGAAEQYRKTLLMAPGDKLLQSALADVQVRLSGGGAAAGAGAETTPPSPRRAPPPLPAAGPGPAAEGGAQRAGAPPVVFAPSRPARAAEPAEGEAGEDGELPPTLRIHASQAATPNWSAPPPPAAPAPAAAPSPPAPPSPAPPSAAPGPSAGAPAAPQSTTPSAAVPAAPVAREQVDGEQEPKTLPGTASGTEPEGRLPAADASEPAEVGSASTAPFSSSTLAELYFQQGLVERAAEVYRQLLEQEPDNQRARLRLAEIESAPRAADERGERRRALERTISGLERLLAAVRAR